MADTFYATLELKNIRMEGLLFSFLEKYSATEFGRNKPMNFRPSGTLRFVALFPSKCLHYFLLIVNI